MKIIRFFIKNLYLGSTIPILGYNRIIQLKMEVMMTRENEIKIQLKQGLSFCWLDKHMADKLSQYSDEIGESRADYIMTMIHNRFTIWPKSQEELKRLDEELPKHGYKNRGDWLREQVRTRIHDEKVRLENNHSPSDEDVKSEINDFMSQVNKYGMPAVYFEDQTLRGSFNATKVEINENYDFEVELYIDDVKSFSMDLYKGRLIPVHRPGNILNSFKKCYILRDREEEYGGYYIGWREDDLSKMKVFEI